VDNTKEYIRHLSLCSGYEGIGSGLRRVLPNVREIAHVEIEAYAIANLVAKMEANEVHPAPVFTNLKEFPFGKFRGCVDIMSGGFPCQPFSTAGKRDGVEDPRHLFPYILEGIRECSPSVIFLENVEGIISSKTADGESVLKYVLRSLEELGYRAEAGVFSASEVGAPHQRKRVFIMAYSNSSGGRKDWEQSELRAVGTEQPSTSTWVRSPEGATTQGQEGLTQSWPARPNKEQFKWEEPRVLGNTINKGHESPRKEQQTEENNYTDKQPKQTQPIMGGATDGTQSRMDSTANRVDRLRLLGNGVVPQVAERAFRVLTARLIC